MKVKCIKNTYETGFINKTVKRNNLTLGKVYEAAPIYTGIQRNIRSVSEYAFLINNDKDEWQRYPLEAFQAVSE